jgi:hypothetical protein
MKVSKKKKQQRTLKEPISFMVCPNCKAETKTGHFMPPSFGQKGRFICDTFTR